MQTIDSDGVNWYTVSVYSVVVATTEGESVHARVQIPLSLFPNTDTQGHHTMTLPKLVNPGLGVIFGRPAAVRPMTAQERLYRSDEERQQEADYLKAAHDATLASRAAWQQAQTQEQADEPILAKAFTAKSMLAPTPEQAAAIARWKAANNIQEQGL
jgi:hypothetical protein